MAISDLLNRRVRAKPDDDENEEAYSEVSGEQDQVSDQSDEEQEDGLSEGSGDEMMDDKQDDDDDEDEDDNHDIQASLNNISFGALAKAQSSMGPRKLKRAKSSATDDADTNTDAAAATNPLDDIRARIREAREQKQSSSSSKKELEKRSSKHAPMVQSTKRAVTRKRTIIEPPATARSRDPRFDPTIVGKNGHMPTGASETAYAFLNDYRAKELKDLKEQMSKTKDPFQRENLQKAIRSATDRLKESENRKREQKILADHKKKEKELIREGKKSNPYYMKKSDLKKEVITRKYNEMNSKDRAKALERRRKKMASKERKEMPMERRGFEGPPPSREGGGMKRKRAA